ncbi:VID27-like protein [Venturia canescens]|uniref:VID27-like protein n=1 Tax=Venturia canescens TaxID=32260 RepID=UPI001C9D0ACF|nr:VID27-like protein [Venturia canescens]
MSFNRVDRSALTKVKNGYIRRVTDEEVKTLALEIAGTNVATTYIFAPKDPKSVLAIGLPFLIMVIKNMKKYFTFEITVLDDKRMHRRFRISNFQSTTKVRPFCTTMPIGLAGGWNQIQFNLADFTRRAYGTNYIETTRMQIHANCRIRRIYFADRLYTEDELPADYKLLFPERRESRARSSVMQAKQPGRKSQGRISVGAVPPDEAPGFRADSEKSEEREERRTTPVASVEPSRTIVAPDRASRVQIEIEALESEGEETTEHEIEPESELEEATIEEQTDQPEQAEVQEQETAFAVEEQREEQEEEREERAEEERAEVEEKAVDEREEEEREEETVGTATEDENEEAFEQDL